MPPPIYQPASATPTDCLRQGEIICDLEEVRLDLSTLGSGTVVLRRTTHPYAIILSQDCDLEQDHKARTGTNAPDKQIPGVLFCEVSTATEVRGTEGMNSKLWSPIPLNKNERYHFLQKVDSDCDALKVGIVELVIDFKKYFTIPTDEVYLRSERGEVKRRCALISPYLEHFSSRFAYFLSRVALPMDHASD